jgi:hypothetical protein
MRHFGAPLAALQPSFQPTVAGLHSLTAPNGGIRCDRPQFRNNVMHWAAFWYLVCCQNDGAFRLTFRLTGVVRRSAGSVVSGWMKAAPQYGRSVMNGQETSNPDTSHAVFEEVCREHRALGGKVARIRQALAGGSIPGEEIAAMLLDLKDALKVHFSNEEFHGFFGEVTARAPYLSREANKLCAEHLEMLDTARRIAHFAVAGGGSQCWWHELNTRFLAFADQLHRHEQDEDSLLQQAFQDDIGVID